MSCHKWWLVHIFLFIPVPSLVKARPALTTTRTLKPATNQRTATIKAHAYLNEAQHSAQQHLSNSTPLERTSCYLTPQQGLHIPLSLAFRSIHARASASPTTRWCTYQPDFKCKAQPKCAANLPRRCRDRQTHPSSTQGLHLR